MGDSTQVTMNETSAHESSSSIDYDLYQKYNRNRAVSDTTYWTLIVAYTFLIVLGSFGNLFVIMAVVKNKGNFTFCLKIRSKIGISTNSVD